MVPRPDREPRRALRHDEVGDATGRWDGWVRAGEHEDGVGDRRVGDVTFRATDHPCVAVAVGAGGQGGRVGTGVGLGEPEGRGHLAGGQEGQPVPLLFLRATLNDHMSGDAVVGAEHRPQRGCSVPELEHQPCLFAHGQPEAAVLLGDGKAPQAHLLGGVPNVERDLVLLVDLVFDRYDTFMDERPHGRKDLGEVRRVHAVTSAGFGISTSVRDRCWAPADALVLLPRRRSLNRYWGEAGWDRRCYARDHIDDIHDESTVASVNHAARTRAPARVTSNDPSRGGLRRTGYAPTDREEHDECLMP